MSLYNRLKCFDVKVVFIALIYSNLLPINIFFGLRPIHIISYVLFALTIVMFLDKKEFYLYSFSFITSCITLSIIIISLFSSLLNGINLVSNINFILNCIIPILFLFILSTHGSSTKSYILIASIQKHIIQLCFLNSMIAIISIFIDFTPIYQYFLASESSVVTRSYNIGRYIGFFLQPFEAGLIYAIGLYLTREVKSKWYVILFIIIAGILSRSKIFFLFLPIFLFFHLNYKWRFLIFLPIISLILGIITLYYSDIYAYVLEPRFGEKSDFDLIVKAISRENLYLGLGLGPLPNNDPFDSAYLQIFSFSGLIGLLAYLILIFYIISFVVFKKRPVENITFLIFILLLCGLAGPIFFSFNLSFFVLFICFKEGLFFKGYNHQ